MSLEHQKWLTKLLGFDFDIHYKPGLENKAADALSRQGTALSLMAVTVPQALLLDEVAEQMARDEKLGAILENLQRVTTLGFALVQGQLLYKD